jgi:hypothetical protein
MTRPAAESLKQTEITIRRQLRATFSTASVRLGRAATSVTCLFYLQYLPWCRGAAIGSFVPAAAEGKAGAFFAAHGASF